MTQKTLLQFNCPEERIIEIHNIITDGVLQSIVRTFITLLEAMLAMNF